MNFSPSERILLISHDAGGAEIISAWAKSRPELAFQFLLEGPAVNIFTRKFPGITLECRDEVFLKGGFCQFVLTGTSWESDLEKKGIAWARRNNIPVASYLDHWVNYEIRFMNDGEKILPGELWVGDEYAFELAEKTFPNHPLKLVPNQYFEEMKRSLQQLNSKPAREEGKIHILYICEPRTIVSQKKFGHASWFGYDEFEALDAYLNYVKNLKELSKVTLRLHPSESKGKYQGIIDKYKGLMRIEEGSRRTLVNDIAEADWIVGCDSMAMVIGVFGGKKVFSCIPPQGIPLTLPFPEIKKLFQK